MTSCQRCGRGLSNSHSIQCGYGPYCAAKLGIDCSQGSRPHTSRGGGDRNNVRDKLREEVEKRVTPVIAVNIGLKLLASSSPPAGILLTSYNLAQRADEIAHIAEKAVREYDKTNDVTETVIAVTPDIARIVLSEVKSQIIDSVVPGTDPESQIVNNVLKAFI